MDRDLIKRVIEAILFISDSSIKAEKFKEVIGPQANEDLTRQLIRELKEEYLGEGRAFEIAEVADGFQMVSDPKYANWIRKFKEKTPPRLSRASLETLAIIAYRQPLTRADIEFIRGVNIEGVISTLLEKGLIKIVGRKDSPGRPYCYGTTKFFLEHFNMKSLEELPALKEFTEQDIELPGDKHKMIEIDDIDEENINEEKRAEEKVEEEKIEEEKIEEAKDDAGEITQENR